MKCLGIIGALICVVSATARAQPEPPPPPAAEPAPVAPTPARPDPMTRGSQADPVPLPAPPPAPTAAPRPARPCVHCRPRTVHRQLAFRSVDARHDFLSGNDPEYRSAHNWRRGGTALAIAGGSIGLLLTSIGLASTMMESTLGHYEDDDSGLEGRTLLIGGLVTMVASVAIGLPIALGANSRMRSIRSRYPIVGMGIGARSGSIQLGWKF